jgi:ACS family tartrate transporter-like MFS transporter
MLAIPLSIVVGGPLSGWLMGLGAPLGLSGWRWMLIAEALPTFAFGVCAWFYFPDQPDDVHWLTSEERRWLERNAANRVQRDTNNDWRILRHPMVWSASVLWFCLLSGAYGIIFWLPQTVRQLSGLSAFQIGLVTALPWAGAMIGTYYNSAHSDRTGERFFHISIPALISAAALVCAWISGPGLSGLALLFIAGATLGAAQGAFWALPTSLLNPRTFAVAAVAINIAGSSGGLVIPYVLGLVRERNGSVAAPTLLIAGILVFAALLVAYIRRVFFATASRLSAS